ncbi:hypothetical protein T440DRAFT_539165 [Plenodomus tracheiphilus IPT5]|uniref:Uncharacterized protein n=1 Tax=Plenodomus tracheiphilus IPT5 TaxID=1408161 RepID=A0A6A7BHZ7_9PLEO|nr:hypothetical protein T440DRAFT_539165 [Plenodomus tracheiphilus IPT5]
MFGYSSPKPTKEITLQCGILDITASISRDMADGDEIYAALRKAFRGGLHEDLYIGVRTPGEHRTYTVTTSLEPIHIPAPVPKGARNIANNLAIIAEHWGLADASTIFPPDIAPPKPGIYEGYEKVGLHPQDPTNWSRNFVEDLKKLSFRTKGRYAEAMQLIIAAMHARYKKMQYPDWPVQTDDIRKALRKHRENMADAALEMMPEEKESTEMFAGGSVAGLDEGLAQAALLALGETGGEKKAKDKGKDEDKEVVAAW